LTEAALNCALRSTCAASAAAGTVMTMLPEPSSVTVPEPDVVTSNSVPPVYAPAEPVKSSIVAAVVKANVADTEPTVNVTFLTVLAVVWDVPRTCTWSPLTTVPFAVPQAL
jgi:hypothetical protein